MRFAQLFGSGVVLTLGLLGCGSSYTAVDESHNGELADGDVDHGGKKCDEYPISVGENWNVDVRMTSEWDNYVFLARGDEDVADNDDGDEGLNAHLVHTVTEAGDYTIFACAYADDGRGAYTLTVTTSEGN